MQTVIINKPDDWHVHFRDEQLLAHTVAATAQHFSRALVMPNLKPALTSVDALLAYRTRIMAAVPEHSTFNPFMTFYLNDAVSIDELNKAATNPFILGAKFYPAGATTNSEAGAESLTLLYPLLEVLQATDQVLQIHGEVTHSDIFAREALFLEEYLQPIINNFPRLRIVLEHISTRAAVDFVTAAPDTVAATITPHHLLYNRNKLLAGGIRPHYYCLPVLKHEDDQKALQRAAISANPKFFAGTDSAPHTQSAKENGCGCAGIYSAPYALAAYAHIFDELEQLNKLNQFTSDFGAQFYRLPTNSDQLELSKKNQLIPHSLPFGEQQIIPMAAGEYLAWSVHGQS